MDDSRVNTGNTIKLILAWGFVGIPLAWGVIQTCINASKLFK
ncbi:MAG: MFS transporter small subunit [Xanthobacteraceae bacterium]